MTKDQLDELQSLLDKATPGPWSVWTQAHDSRLEGGHGEVVAEKGHEPREHEQTGRELHDLETITALRNHAQELIDAARALQRIQRLPSLDKARASSMIMQVAAQLAKMPEAEKARLLQTAVDQWSTHTALLEAENRKLRDLLRRVEWSGNTADHYDSCPFCMKPAFEGHGTGCDLAGALNAE